MARTREQVAADEALAQAIEQCRAAYVEDEERGIVTEYLVLYASRSWDSEGDGLTAIGTVVSQPAEPLHHQLGLVEYVASELRRAAAE